MTEVALLREQLLRWSTFQFTFEMKREADEDEDSDESWASEWIRFAETISGVDKPDWADISAVHLWVDSVSQAFSTRFGIRTAFDAES